MHREARSLQPGLPVQLCSWGWPVQLRGMNQEEGQTEALCGRSTASNICSLGLYRKSC